MTILKNIVVFLVLMLFFGLIYNLIRQRQQILALEGFQEGITFFTPTPVNELVSLQNKDPTGISNVKDTSLPLIQYCMKGSYNTAFTGNYMNKDMVKYVITRGCRFLDFEVYPNTEADGNTNLIPTVSCKIATPQITETLEDILNTVGTYGFMGNNVPNADDPIFIHLRIYTNGNNYLYSQIASVIKQSKLYSADPSRSKLYQKDNVAIPVIMNSYSSNTPSTKFSDIMGKVIIILNKDTFPDYDDEKYLCDNNASPAPASVQTKVPAPAPSNKCVNLKDFVNMLSGNSNPTYSYSQLMEQNKSPPIVNDNGKICDNIKSFKIVFPDTGSSYLGLGSVANYVQLPSQYGAQVLMYPFYNNDADLGDYEKLFANTGAAFVPMAVMVNTIKSEINKKNYNRTPSTNPKK